MSFTELSAPVSDEARYEILAAMLSDLPFEGFRYEDGYLKACMPSELMAVHKAVADLVVFRYGEGEARYAEVADRDWNAEWEASFRTVDIDGACRIRAPFCEAPPRGWLDIIIEPRMAFGTGHHVTTRLVMRRMLEQVPAGLRVLDLGCGTGVLAIGAARAGAVEVDAVDTDLQCCSNAGRNVALNGVSDVVRVVHGGAESVAGRRYALILANINRNTLMASMPSVAALLSEGGRLVMSGFLEHDARLVERAAAEAGLQAGPYRSEDGWGCLECFKGNGPESASAGN